MQNQGTADLSVYNIISDSRLVRVAPQSFTLSPGSSRTITATLTPLPNKVLAGNITINSDDTNIPTQEIVWEASLVKNDYLSLSGSFPESGDRSVAIETDIELTFAEALFQRGRYVDLDAKLFPAPLSGPLMDSFELRGSGNTVLFPVELADDTSYRLVIYGASSDVGAELFDPIEIPFTTGQRFEATGSLSGKMSVGNLGEDDFVVGNVSLFDQNQQLVAREPVGPDGTFRIDSIAEGEYFLFSDVRLSTGEDVEATYDTDGDGQADVIDLSEGENLTDLFLEYEEALVGLPGNFDRTGFSVDLGQGYGDQGIAELDVSTGEEFNVSVYAQDVDALTGYVVSVAYDSSAIELIRAVEDVSFEGTNLLKSSSGMPLFLGADLEEDVISVGGALLSPTNAQATEGEGLLAVFRFVAKDGFTGDTVPAESRVLDDVLLVERKLILAHNGAHAFAPATKGFQVSGNLRFFVIHGGSITSSGLLARPRTDQVHPPPPGVSIRMRSPGSTSTEQTPGSSSHLSFRKIICLPDFPLGRGFFVLRWVSSETVIFSRNSISLIKPSPPRQVPPPPEFFLIPNSQTRTGYRSSRISTSVMAVLLM